MELHDSIKNTDVKNISDELKKNINNVNMYLNILKKTNELSFDKKDEFIKQSLLNFVKSSKNKNDIKIVLEYLFELDQLSLRNEAQVISTYGLNSNETSIAHDKTMALNKNYVSIVKSIVDKYGWLSEKEIGVMANQTLWIIIQHSDLETQLNFYPIMESECNKGNVSKEQLAKLIDRMLVLQGKEQLYGTQFRITDDFNYDLYPISNKGEVDARRQSVGLGSLQDEIDNLISINSKKTR